VSAGRRYKQCFQDRVPVSFPGPGIQTNITCLCPTAHTARPSIDTITEQVHFKLPIKFSALSVSMQIPEPSSFSIRGHFDIHKKKIWAGPDAGYTRDKR